MDTILAITDFSLSAYNAGRFAIGLARSMNAKVIVFNVFPDYSENNTPETARFLNNEARKISQAALAAELENINPTSYPHVTAVNRKGPLLSAILKTATSSKANLIIAASGQKAASGINMFGSLIVDLMEATRVPVMLIPLKKQPADFTRMLILDESHLEKKIRNDHRLLLKKLIHVFEPRVYVVTVVPDITTTTPEQMGPSEAVKSLGLEGAHSVYLGGNNMPEGMVEFAENNSIDLLTMLREDAGRFKQSIDALISSVIVFDMAIPLLMLPLG